MKEYHDLITTPDSLRIVCEKLAQHDMIGVDTEFIRENTFFPIIAMIQLATSTEAWLVDAKELSRDDLSPLFAVLTNKQILKIFHAAQADQECLFCSYGITASPTLDTSEAAALTGHGGSAGLGRLLHDVLGVTIRKGHARCNWLARPLSHELKRYALADVTHLVALGKQLLVDLDHHGRRELALTHSAQWEDPARYTPDPDGISTRLAKSGKVDGRGYALLKRLVAWRETRARELNIPRRRLADDSVLVDLARTRPRTLDQLNSFRGLHRGEIQKQGTALLKFVEEVEHLPEKKLPSLPQRERSCRQNPQLADFISCVIRLLANRHHIAPHHLMMASHINALSAGTFASLDAIVEAGLLTEEGRRLIGDDLWKILSGTMGMRIQKGKIILFDLTQHSS